MSVPVDTPYNDARSASSSTLRARTNRMRVSMCSAGIDSGFMSCRPMNARAVEMLTAAPACRRQAGNWLDPDNGAQRMNGLLLLKTAHIVSAAIIFGTGRRGIRQHQPVRGRRPPRSAPNFYRSEVGWKSRDPPPFGLFR